MASTAFSEAATKSLHEDGFLDLNELEVGNFVLGMEQKGFQHLSLLSPYGLDYYKQCVVDHPRIKSILESVLHNCSLGHWLRYGALPGHIECYRRGGQEAGLRALVVQQWAKGSRVDYYRGSHLLNMPAQENKRWLFETTKAALNEAGCYASEEEYPDGGVVIRDARLYAEIKTGYAITFMFATDEVLSSWPKIRLPNSPDLIRKIVNLESSAIRVNFAIEDSTGSPSK